MPSPAGSRQLGSRPSSTREQPAAFQGLTVVGRHQFRHQPQRRFPLALLAGTAPFEDVRPVSGPNQVVGDVVHVGGVVVLSRAGQGVEDEPPVLDGFVAGFQVGGEEGGRLPAVAEQQELAAFPGLVCLLTAGGGREGLVERRRDHGGGGVTAGLELAHHGRAARAAGQAAGDGVRLRVQPPHRPQPLPSAGAARGPRDVQGSAPGAEHAVIGVEGTASLFQGLVVFVHHDRRVPREQPGPGFGGALPGSEDQPLQGMPHGSGQVHGPAAFAGAELEHGGRAAAAGFPAGQGDVRARLRQAGVGAFTSPGE